jgi:MoxR-like ATPase
VFTRTAMHTAPKDFLFIGIMSRTGARLNHHLNDIFCMSHFHASEDGLPYTDGELKRDLSPPLPITDVVILREQARKARITGEVASYLHNIVLFMRTSRYVTSGVTATATKQLRILSSALAPLHGLDYVPPSLVVLAAHKIYPHRLVLATPSTEKSLQWGSDPSAIGSLLEGITVEGVIEDVLASFESPL